MNAKMKLLISVIATTALTFSCNHENETNQPSDLNGHLVSQSECKDMKSGTGTSAVTDSLSCVEFTYEATNNKLIMKHINAGFNCCPGNLTCNVSISNDTIFVQEFEAFAQCNCNCLYDLGIEITGINNQKYHVKFIEPYIGNQMPLNFTIDLPNGASGSYCVTRNNYPWGF